MSVPVLFTRFPNLKNSIPWVSLIQKPTDLSPLTAIESSWNATSLLIKREDQTGRIYGGNKVRNLEFVLGDALSKKKSSVVTLVPYGSNFTAALSAQAKLLGIKTHLCQFVAQRNVQMDAHADFSLAQGSLLHTYNKKLGPVLAAVSAIEKTIGFGGENSYWISPGASSVTGALGHVNAALEFANQIVEQGLKIPDYLIVGAGTCGTITGLTVGLQLAGLPTKVIGVRCAEKIVCNLFKIRRLGQAVINRLGVNAEFDLARIQIVESPENTGYGIPTPAALDVGDEFFDLTGLALDSTYTSKVVLFIKKSMPEFTGKNLLYWHTYSSAAMSSAVKMNRTAATPMKGETRVQFAQ